MYFKLFRDIALTALSNLWALHDLSGLSRYMHNMISWHCNITLIFFEQICLVFSYSNSPAKQERFHLIHFKHIRKKLYGPIKQLRDASIEFVRMMGMHRLCHKRRPIYVC